MKGMTMMTAATSLLLVSCRDPTEMRLELRSDVPCANFHGVTIAVGGGDETETAAPGASSTDCALGSIVVVPSGSEQASVAIRIVAAEGRDVASCTAPDYGPGCIVARRRLAFLPHTRLDLRILLARACEGVRCTVGTTCVEGACRNAYVDPSRCAGGGCDEPPPETSADAGPDAAAYVDDCGDTTGLAASPWPMAGRCPTRIARSPYVGPRTNAVRWVAELGSPMNVGPAIGADGTIYVGANGGLVHAVSPDGGKRWSATVDGNVNGSIAAVAADGVVYTSATSGGLYAITPLGAPTAAVPASTPDQFRGAALVAPDGIVWMGGRDGALYGYTPPSGVQKLAFGSDPLGSPAMGSDGTLYLTGAGTLHGYAARPPHDLWSVPLGTGGPTATDPMIGRDGNVYVGFGAALVSVDPRTKQVRWSAPLPAAAASASGLAPAEGPDGTIFVEDIGGVIHAVDPASGVAREFARLAPNGWGLGLTIDREGTVYGMSADRTFKAFAADGRPLWSLTLAGNAFSAGAIGADRTIYFTTETGQLFAVGP